MLHTSYRTKFVFLGALLLFVSLHFLVPAFLNLSGTAERVLEKGNFYFNVGNTGKYDLNKAEKYFNRALQIDPMVPDAWHQLARIDFLRGDFDSALTKINTQIELHNDSLMSSYYIRGLIFGYMGRYEEAEDDFLVFLEWDPTNWAAYNDLSWIYFSEGRFKDASRVAREGLEYNPENPWLLNMYGVSLMNLGNTAGAKDALEKAYSHAELLTESAWHFAYPGNNLASASRGLEEMLRAIRGNLELVVGN